MPAVWDVVVVGAGPAGAAAALAARATRPHASVLLVDRAAFPRDKACGDGIAPHAVTVLDELGAADAVQGYRRIEALQLSSPRGASVCGQLPGPGYVIPRTVFDARLVTTALERGIPMVRRTVRHVERTAGGVRIDGDLHARTVIGADGAESRVRRALGLAGNGPHHLAVAMRGYAPVSPAAPMTQWIAMSEHDWPAYAWDFPIGDGRSNVGYGEVLRGRTLTRDALLDRLRRLAPQVRPDPGTLRAHRLPLSSQRPRQPDGRVLLAGDAHSLINPLTGEGIHYALLSGMLAGRAAVAFDEPGSAYRGALRRALGTHLRQMRVVARLARSPSIVDAGVAAANRRPEVFTDLAEMGLGAGLVTSRLLRGLPRHLLCARLA